MNEKEWNLSSKSGFSDVKAALMKKSFKVAVFGSARIKPGHKAYTKVYNLAKMIAQSEMDLVTGGGPGLMQAANEGYKEGRKSNNSHSYGLLIQIENERRKSHADIEKNFDKFSERLDNFMLLSNAIVVAPGGVGTMLEFFYTWQLLQVNKIRHIPVILMGTMWVEFVKWIEENPMKHGFISPQDLYLVHVARTAEDAMKILQKEFAKYQKKNKKKN